MPGHPSEGDPSGGSGPSTPALAAGAGESSKSLRRRETTVVLPNFANDAFYGHAPLSLLRLWGVDTLVICGTVANLRGTHAAIRRAARYEVVIPRYAISAGPFT